MENIIKNNKLIAEFMGGYQPEEFHKSWDWLIPVVEKIANIKNFYSIESDLLDMRATAKIEDVYSAVIHFIKWYNQCNTK